MNMPRTAVGAGRFDAKPNRVVARLHRAAESQSVYMATEVMPDQWRAIKANLPEGWKAVHLNEYLIAWDDRVLRAMGLRGRWLEISGRRFNRGRIRIHAKVGSLRLADRGGTDQTYCDVAHLPAHLQAGNGYTKVRDRRDEVTAHQQALRALGKRARRRKRNHPDRRQVLGADVNVDLFRPAWRNLLEHELGLTGVWRDDLLPPRGDMGDRLITGVWTYRCGTTFGTVTPTPKGEEGLDHRMVSVWS